MRLDKYIADACALTRSEARSVIKCGNVTISDEAVRDIARQVSESEHVFLDGEKHL